MIRSEMIRWQEVTERLLLLAARTDEAQRDETIEEVDRLLTERDGLQPKIAPPFTDEEQALGHQLIKLDGQMTHALANFMKNIRTDIAAAQSKKTHVGSYVNPYGKVTRDGTFYDTKQ